MGYILKFLNKSPEIYYTQPRSKPYATKTEQINRLAVFGKEWTLLINSSRWTHVIATWKNDGFTLNGHTRYINSWFTGQYIDLNNIDMYKVFVKNKKHPALDLS